MELQQCVRCLFMCRARNTLFIYKLYTRGNGHCLAPFILIVSLIPVIPFLIPAMPRRDSVSPAAVEPHCFSLEGAGERREAELVLNREGELVLNREGEIGLKRRSSTRPPEPPRCRPCPEEAPERRFLPSPPPPPPPAAVSCARALTRPCPPSFPGSPPLPAGPLRSTKQPGRAAAPARGGPGAEGSGLGAGPVGQCRALPLSAPALAAGCALLPPCLPALPRRVRFAFTLLFLIIII